MDCRLSRSEIVADPGTHLKAIFFWAICPTLSTQRGEDDLPAPRLLLPLLKIQRDYLRSRAQW